MPIFHLSEPALVVLFWLSDDVVTLDHAICGILDTAQLEKSEETLRLIVMAFYEPMEESDYLLRRLVRFLPSHHSAALNYYPQRHVINLLRAQPGAPDIPLIRGVAEAVTQFCSSRGGNFEMTDDPTELYYFYLRQATEVHEMDEKASGTLAKLRMTLQASFGEVNLDLKAISHSNPGLPPSCTSFINHPLGTAETVAQLTTRVCYYKDQLSQIRSCMQADHLNHVETLSVLVETEEVTVAHCREILMVYFPGQSRKVILLNYDQLLMLHDTLACRLMCKTTLAINEITETDNLPPPALLSTVYSWGDELIRDFGVNAYSVLGEFEAMVTAVFVGFQGTDPLKLGDQFMQSVLKGFEEIELMYKIPVSRAMSLIETLQGVSSVNWLSEIFGLRKHWGNPMVDAVASGDAVQEKVNEVLPVSGYALLKLEASFNRMITLEYIKQHGEWPKCSFDEGSRDTPLARAHAARNTKVPETHREHHHLHWCHLKFEPNATIGSYRNDMSTISDKAVSVYRKNLDSLYVRSLCTAPVPRLVEENRRLVLEYIRKDHLTILDICRIVMSGTVPAEWLANSASMKGTEMKHLKARIFAVLTYELRQYFAVTEDIIKNSVFRYNPHQTMTLSENELLSRLRQVTRQLDPDSDSRFLSVIHIVDFSKWNLRMRYSNTSGVFKSVDNFLGTPGLIESTHGLFNDMVNVINDPFNPPQGGVAQSESSTVWRLHSCGWEGQRQKGWTLLTSAVLSDLERETGVNSFICGQGDNQALLSKFPIPTEYKNARDWINRAPDDVRRVLDDFYVKLSEECELIGLKIKTAETCRSLCFFNYGKRLYFSGVELSMMLKRISKNVTEPNESYPTSESLLKTLEGSAYAAGLYSHPSLLPYLMSRFAVGLQLYDSFKNNQLVRTTGERILQANQLTFNTRFLSTLLKIPSLLGGPPQQLFPAYLFRGHPDPGCSELVSVVLRARAGCDTSRRILELGKSGSWFDSEETDKLSLISSPYSLNLNVPLTARAPLEKAILPALRKNCHNSLVSGMLSLDVDSMEDQIVATLSSMTPFQPVIANDVFSRTIPGRRQAFLSGLANTTSLGRLIYEARGSPIIRRIRDLEVDQLVCWTLRVKNVLSASITSPDWDTPHHILMQEWRNKSWNCEIVGVTVPHPLEQFVLVTATHDICTDDCKKHLEEHILMIRHSEDLIRLEGSDSGHVSTVRSRKGNPYLGSSISEGIIQRQVTCMNPDETWRDVIRLNTVRRWVCSPDSLADSVFKCLIATRTNVDPVTIDAATGYPSRTAYNHRAALMATVQSTNVSATTNMHSRIYTSSNRMGEYSHGEYNYHMPFGAVFLCFQEIICLMGIMQPDLWRSASREVYHIHVRSRNVPTVFEGNVSLTVPVQLQAGVQLRRSPLLFTHAELLEFSVPTGLIDNSSWEETERADYFVAKYAYAYQLVGDSFVKEIGVHELMTVATWSDFTHRSVPVSVGDVNLVGVRHLVRAISWHMLLIAPPSIWEQTDSSTFSVGATQFVAGFSSSFWTRFSQPMSASRISRQLFSHYSSLGTPYASRTVGGLNETLRLGVVKEMWRLHVSMRNAVRREDSTAIIDIYAATLASLRLLWSKYLEYCSFVALHQCGVRVSQARRVSRELSTDVLSCPEETFPSASRMIILKFSHLCGQLGFAGLYIPKASYWSLQHSWIDKLRHTLSDTEDSIDQAELLEFPNTYPALTGTLDFQSVPNPVLITIPDCVCVPYGRSDKLHTECYFALSGRLSKSHMRFLEIIYAKQLSISTVICLGSSTGSEAFALAKHRCCKSVYVNCHLPLTGFSPHLAGDYIPAAFVGNPLAAKLICPSSAAVAVSDVSDAAIVGVILDHLSDHDATGLTCDIEMPLETGSEKQLFLSVVTNVLEICSQIRSITWCAIKLPINCVHHLQLVVGKFLLAFRSVCLHSSPFSRPGMPTLFLVATERLAAPTVRLQSTNSVPLLAVPDESLLEFISKICTRDVCPLFMCRKKDVIERLAVVRCSQSSYSTACNRFIPGWNVAEHEDNSPSAVNRQLCGIKKILMKTAIDKINTFFKAHSSLMMPANTILQLEMSPLHQQLNSVFELVARTDLLSSIVAEDKMDLVSVTKKIYDWLIEEQSYMMSNRPFSVKKNATRFINLHSRYLFEILGHVFRTQYVFRPIQSAAFVYHKELEIPVRSVADELFLNPPFIDRHYVPNLKWQWRRRSEILFWLVARHVLEMPVSVMTQHGHHLEALHAIGRLLDVEAAPFMTSGCNAVFCTDPDEVERFLPLMADLSLVCLPVSGISILSSSGKVDGYFKCPWSGLVPNMVIIRWIREPILSPLAWLSGLYPNMRYWVNKCYSTDAEFLGCNCWDCVVERTLTKRFNILPSWLDAQCSLQSIETVRDMYHLL